MKCGEALAKTAVVSLPKERERGWNYSIDLVSLLSIHANTNTGIVTFNIWIYTPITTYLLPSLSSDILFMDISLFLFTWVIVPASEALAACRAAPDSGRFHHLSLAQPGVRQWFPSGRVKGVSRDQKQRHKNPHAALSASLMMCSHTQADARAAAREAPKNSIILWLSNSHGSL